MVPDQVKVNLPQNWREIVKSSAGERRDVSVSEKEVGDVLHWLRNSRASYAQVLRPIKEGDSVEVSFEMRNRATPVPGGKVESHRLIVGSGGHLPGFERELIGMSAGEERTFSLHAPDSYWAKAIAGKDVGFHVKVKSVQDRTLPELSDELAQSVGKFKDLAELKKSISEGLHAEKEVKERERFRLAILETLDERAGVEFPQPLLAKELTAMLEELKASVHAMELPWPEYLAQIKKTEEDLMYE